MKTSTKQVKTVKIIFRYLLKASGNVVYKVLASNGVDTYCTTLVNGKATGCTCPSRSGNCYHRTQLEVIEAQRNEALHPALFVDSTSSLREIVIASVVLEHHSAFVTAEQILARQSQTVDAVGESIESVLDEANCLMSETPDETAAIESDMDEPVQRTRFAEWLLQDTYEVLAPTKHVAPLEWVKSTCVHCGKGSKSGWCGC